MDESWKCACGCGCRRSHVNPTGSYCRDCAAGDCGDSATCDDCGRVTTRLQPVRGGGGTYWCCRECAA